MNGLRPAGPYIHRNANTTSVMATVLAAAVMVSVVHCMFWRAVARDRTRIATSSFTSRHNGVTAAGVSKEERALNSIQNSDSSPSSIAIPSFAMKSDLERPRHAAR